MNEIYWLLMLLAVFLMVILTYKIFGRKGLFIWIPIAAIIANIQVVQTLELFGFVATLGNIVYASLFLVTDILSEIYGKKEARRAVWVGFFSVIVMTALMNMTLLFEPIQGDDFSMGTFESLSSIFTLMPRIVIASLIAYLVSQQHDVWAYHFWKNRFEGVKFIWLRNNLSTMVSQLIDSVLFTFIAFYGQFEFPVLIEIFATTYLLKWIVAVADTPFIYWAAKIKEKQTGD